jgi:hypothetical protein
MCLWHRYGTKFLTLKPSRILSGSEHFFNKVYNSISGGHLVFENAATALFLCTVHKTPSYGVLHRFWACWLKRRKLLLALGLRRPYCQQSQYG